MKKRKSSRMLCVLLILLLVGQLAVTAFAAETVYLTADDSYTDTNGYHWIFEVTRTRDEVVLRNQPITSTKKYHTKGTATPFFAGTYTISKTPALALSPYSDVRTLALQLEIPLSYSLDAYTNGITVPAYLESGYFCLDTDYYGYSGSWDVQVDEGFGYYIWMDGGNYDIAPYGSMGITGYVRYS